MRGKNLMNEYCKDIYIIYVNTCMLFVLKCNATYFSSTFGSIKFDFFFSANSADFHRITNREKGLYFLL